MGAPGWLYISWFNHALRCFSATYCFCLFCCIEHVEQFDIGPEEYQELEVELVDSPAQLKVLQGKHQVYTFAIGTCKLSKTGHDRHCWCMENMTILCTKINTQHTHTYLIPHLHCIVFKLLPDGVWLWVGSWGKLENNAYLIYWMYTENQLLLMRLLHILFSLWCPLVLWTAASCGPCSGWDTAWEQRGSGERGSAGKRYTQLNSEVIDRKSYLQMLCIASCTSMTFFLFSR